MKYKNPESILVVIYCSKTQRYLMLQRQDDLSFWQSVTGSLEEGEIPFQTALREVKEETGIDIILAGLVLKDLQYAIEFEIFPQFKHRYAPNVNINKEHWFSLDLPQEIVPILTEHLAYRWLPFAEAQPLTPSWNNRQALQSIEQSIANQF